MLKMLFGRDKRNSAYTRYSSRKMPSIFSCPIDTKTMMKKGTHPSGKLSNLACPVSYFPLFGLYRSGRNRHRFSDCPGGGGVPIRRPANSERLLPIDSFITGLLATICCLTAALTTIIVWAGVELTPDKGILSPSHSGTNNVRLKHKRGFRLVSFENRDLAL